MRYELQRKKKVSKPSTLKWVLTPLCILMLGYMGLLIYAFDRIDLKIFMLMCLPLVALGVTLDVYFRRHTTTQTSTLEFCDDMMLYREDSILFGECLYRIRKAYKVGTRGKDLYITGDVEKIKGASCTHLTELNLEGVLPAVAMENLNAFIASCKEERKTERKGMLEGLGLLKESTDGTEDDWSDYFPKE